MRIFPDDHAAQIFEQAFEEYKDGLFRHCYFHTFDREKAKDLAQEAFLKTWEYIADGHSIENLQAFLYKVATNSIYNDTRKKKEMSLETLQEQGFDPPTIDREQSRDFIEEARVLNILKHVDESYRTMVILRYIENFSPAEIADITGLSSNVVSVRLNRGIKQLRKFLKADE